MQILPKEVSRFDIPICRMVYVLLICPTLANDIKRLEVEFIHGYQPGARMFHVSICNELGEERSISDEEMSNWSSQ